MTDNWTFIDGVEPQGSSDGFWYDLTFGGYIEPAKLLADERQLKKVIEAINVLTDFEAALHRKGLINEF